MSFYNCTNGDPLRHCRTAKSIISRAAYFIRKGFGIENRKSEYLKAELHVPVKLTAHIKRKQSSCILSTHCDLKKKKRYEAGTEVRLAAAEP